MQPSIHSRCLDEFKRINKFLKTVMKLGFVNSLVACCESRRSSCCKRGLLSEANLLVVLKCISGYRGVFFQWIFFGLKANQGNELLQAVTRESDSALVAVTKRKQAIDTRSGAFEAGTKHGQRSRLSRFSFASDWLITSALTGRLPLKAGSAHAPLS